MKVELGRCLLRERLNEADMGIVELSAALNYKQERLIDFIEGKRIMPLKTAISIAHTIGCEVNNLYELIPVETAL